MRKLLVALALVFMGPCVNAQMVVKRGPITAGGFTPFDFCVDFRDTSTFVTDPSPCTYEADDATGQVVSTFYPISRAGKTIGWLSTAGQPFTRDRDNTTANTKLSGMNFMIGNGSGTATPMDYRIDVPPGTYTVWVVLGDYSFNHLIMNAEVLDNTTSRFTISSNTSTNFFIDANGVGHGQNYVPVVGDAKTGVAINSGTFIFRCKDDPATGNFVTTCAVAHIRLTRTS